MVGLKVSSFFFAMRGYMNTLIYKKPKVYVLSVDTKSRLDWLIVEFSNSRRVKTYELTTLIFCPMNCNGLSQVLYIISACYLS